MLVRFESVFYCGLIALSLYACNPFAPGLEEVNPNTDELLGNRRNIDGVFEWFKNSYELKDTTTRTQLV